MNARSSFPKTTDKKFADTRSAGGITIRGFELVTDADGCVEGPADLANDLAPHGFFPDGSPEFAAFMAAKKKPEAKK